MNIKIIKNSSTELIITQQKKLTLTGSAFCIPAVMLLFRMPLISGMTLLISSIILWFIVILCFYKGITYTFKANKTDEELELLIKGFFRTTKKRLHYDQINHVIMAESDGFFKSTVNYSYRIIIETSDKKHLRIFNFKNRQDCKQTRALIDSYL